jgi:predicted membrane protein
MKMGSSLFWGILLIVIGLSLVIKIVFNIDFPIFKIIIAFIFIYIGIRIMVGSSFRPFGEHKTESDVIFGESHFKNAQHGRDYNVVFSKGNFDLRDIKLNETGPTYVKINTVFGASEVIIRREMPVRIKVDAAFAGAQLPNGNSAAFGSTIYTSDSLDLSKPYLDIKADIAFGGLNVRAY